MKSMFWYYVRAGVVYVIIMVVIAFAALSYSEYEERKAGELFKNKLAFKIALSNISNCATLADSTTYINPDCNISFSPQKTISTWMFYDDTIRAGCFIIGLSQTTLCAPAFVIDKSRTDTIYAENYYVPLNIDKK